MLKRKCSGNDVLFADTQPDDVEIWEEMGWWCEKWQLWKDMLERNVLKRAVVCNIINQLRNELHFARCLLLKGLREGGGDMMGLRGREKLVGWLVGWLVG